MVNALGRGARSTLSPRAGRGWGEGASTLPERSKSSLPRYAPYPLRIAERPPQPILLPARGEKEPRAARGEQRDARSRSRDAPAPEACRPKPRILSPQRSEGRRSAGRRDCPVGPRHAADVAIHLRFGRKPRVLRDALASRRSTAALSEVSRPRRFDSRPGFLGRGPGGRYPLFPVPVQRKHPAHRSSCRRT